MSNETPAAAPKEKKPIPPHPHSLKEKSASSAQLKVGPFAAIRENEMKRKKKASLDLEDEKE